MGDRATVRILDSIIFTEHWAAVERTPVVSLAMAEASVEQAWDILLPDNPSFVGTGLDSFLF